MQLVRRFLPGGSDAEMARFRLTFGVDKQKGSFGPDVNGS